MNRMDWLRVLAVIASENALDSEEHDISDMVGHSDDEGSSGNTVWDDDWYAYDKDDGTTSWDEFEADIYGDDYYGK